MNKKKQKIFVYSRPPPFPHGNAVASQSEKRPAVSPLLTLLLASLVIMGSPGPSSISATATGAAFGIRRALPYVIGLIAGTTTVLLAVALGLASLIVAIPAANRAISIAGSLYILYLAYKIATAPPLGDPTHHATAPTFLPGYLLGIANPKAYLAIAAVYAGTTLSPNPIADATSKLAALGTMIALIHLFWLTIGVSLAHALRHPVASRCINAGMALALVATTVTALAR